MIAHRQVTAFLRTLAHSKWSHSDLKQDQKFHHIPLNFKRLQLLPVHYKSDFEDSFRSVRLLMVCCRLYSCSMCFKCVHPAVFCSSPGRCHSKSGESQQQPARSCGVCTNSVFISVPNHIPLLFYHPTKHFAFFLHDLILSELTWTWLQNWFNIVMTSNRIIITLLDLTGAVCCLCWSQVGWKRLLLGKIVNAIKV